MFLSYQIPQGNRKAGYRVLKLELGNFTSNYLADIRYQPPVIESISKTKVEVFKTIGEFSEYEIIKLLLKMVKF